MTWSRTLAPGRFFSHRWQQLQVITILRLRELSPPMVPRPHRIQRCERMDYRAGFTGADQKKYPTFHLSISWNSICNTKLHWAVALVWTFFGIIQFMIHKVNAGGQFSRPDQIETMSTNFDPNDELFRSCLVKTVSSIIKKLGGVRIGYLHQKIKYSHFDVLLRDPPERAQHEKTHFTFECKYCCSLFVHQSKLTRHLEKSHKMKSLLLWSEFQDP